MPKPVVAMVRATYTDQNALETFFTEIFGPGQSTVIWTRGRYQCTIPRPLNQDEIQKLQQTIHDGHYSQP